MQQQPQQCRQLSNIAVLTSGGDCQGMNSVLYGLICRHLDSNNIRTELYFIYNGFQGLIDGTIVKADKKILHHHIYQGGTIINSSRCREFYHQDGRRKAAYNLLRLNIENLIVIGGDGSLTGANYLRREWPQFVREFSDMKNGEKRDSMINGQLNLIGIIGSIDNDFIGSEMTIGTDSALSRVVESIDALKTTAKSHSRAMVVEVMGRNCGYLAISSALCTQASYVFIPEYPHRSNDEWQNKLFKRIQYERNNGQYYH
ncbi:phosphofructokinase, liver-like protein, partial [Euroglyphus maynei]